MLKETVFYRRGAPFKNQLDKLSDDKIGFSLKKKRARSGISVYAAAID